MVPQVAWARRLGCLFSVHRSLGLLRELGADRGIDYEQEDFATDDETFHVVFDTVGNASFRDCELILEERGVYVTTSFEPAIVIQGVISLVGRLFGPIRRARAVIVKPSGQDLAVLGRLIDTGKLRPHVEEIFRLDRVADAHSYSESGHVRGKLVIGIE